MSTANSTVEFQPIQGFPGYRVGSDGSIWSCRPLNGRGPLKGSWHKLKLFPCASGHMMVNLHPPLTQLFVHRLVLEAFVGPCPEGMQCRHFPDRDPGNNRLENLQWGTIKENAADRKIHGTARKGEQINTAKLTEEKVRAIREEAAIGVSVSSIAKKYGVWPNAITLIIRRRSWKHVL